MLQTDFPQILGGKNNFFFGNFHFLYRFYCCYKLCFVNTDYACFATSLAYVALFARFQVISKQIGVKAGPPPGHGHGSN